MPGIQPTYGIIETGRNVYAFTNAHKKELWGILLPLLPWILALHFFDVVAQAVLPPEKEIFAFGSLFATYFYACFAISWHRVLLFGAEHAQRMNPFKPEKSDLGFFFMGLVLWVAFFVMGFAVGYLQATGSSMTLYAAISTFVLLYFFYKMSFYFPAKAVRSHMSLHESFMRTRGYFWRMVIAPFLSMWRSLLVFCLFFIMMVIVIGAVAPVLGYINPEVPPPPAFQLLLGVLITPAVVYFYPLFYAYGVGVLSNYYQHALQMGPPQKRVVKRTL